MCASTPPVEIYLDHQFVIGRSKKADLTVSSAAVSREHAIIFWRGWEPWIKDCGSNNGTKVNGAHITEHKLEDGDEIRVGPFTGTYRCVGASEAFGPLELRGNSSLVAGVVGGPLSGKLTRNEMLEVLATLQHKEKTGTLLVKSGTERGVLVVRQGKPLFAKAGLAEGDAAIQAMLTWTTGIISFLTLVDEEAINVERSLQEHIAEARQGSSRMGTRRL